MATKKAPDNTAALVDECGDLKKELDPLELKRKRYDAVRKTLRERYANAPADAPVTLDGQRFTLTLGEKEHETTIDTAAAFKLLGRAKFLNACKLTLTALKAVVAPDSLIALCSIERSGSRPITIAEKGTPAK
jgi:hypothetical protein